MSKLEHRSKLVEFAEDYLWIGREIAGLVGAPAALPLGSYFRFWELRHLPLETSTSSLLTEIRTGPK